MQMHRVNVIGTLRKMRRERHAPAANPVVRKKSRRDGLELFIGSAHLPEISRLEAACAGRRLS